MDTQTYRVTGMTCGGCARHVDKAIRAVPGVIEVVVDAVAGTARVTGSADLAALAARVAEAGYELSGKV